MNSKCFWFGGYIFATLALITVMQWLKRVEPLLAEAMVYASIATAGFAIYKIEEAKIKKDKP